MAGYRALSNQQRAGYEYRAEDRSLLSPWLSVRLWQPLVRWLPASISANQLTWVGASCALASWGVLAWQLTPGSLALSALAVVVYHTLDAVDGLHARRTGTAGPRGELLDHVLDGFSQGFVLWGMCLAFGTPRWGSAAILALGSIATFVPFLRQRLTGDLLIPKVGATEALLLLVVIYLVVACVGLRSFQAPLLGPMSMADLLSLETGVSLAALAATGLRGIVSAARPLLGTSLPLGLAAAWASLSALPASLCLGVVMCLGAALSAQPVLARLAPEVRPGVHVSPLWTALAIASLAAPELLQWGFAIVWLTVLALGSAATAGRASRVLAAQAGNSAS